MPGPDKYDALQKKATLAMMEVFEASAAELAKHQITLALSAEDESVQERATARIVKQVMGAPKQTIEQNTKGIQIVSHMGIPEIAVPREVGRIEATVIEAETAEPSVREFKVADVRRSASQVLQKEFSEDEEDAKPKVHEGSELQKKTVIE